MKFLLTVSLIFVQLILILVVNVTTTGPDECVAEGGCWCSTSGGCYFFLDDKVNGYEDASLACKEKGAQLPPTDVIIGAFVNICCDVPFTAPYVFYTESKAECTCVHVPEIILFFQIKNHCSHDVPVNVMCLRPKK